MKLTADDHICQQEYFCDIFYGNCRTVFEKISVSIHRKPKKCHYDSEGVQDEQPRKGGMEPMEKSQELIGILQAISIVAKSLAAKLMQIEKEVDSFLRIRTATRWWRCIGNTDSTTWSRGTTISTGCRCLISRPTSAVIPTAATWQNRA